jgi:hypothetical protein
MKVRLSGAARAYLLHEASYLTERSSSAGVLFSGTSVLLDSAAESRGRACRRPDSESGGPVTFLDCFNPRHFKSAATTGCGAFPTSTHL